MNARFGALLSWYAAGMDTPRIHHPPQLLLVLLLSIGWISCRTSPGSTTGDAAPALGAALADGALEGEGDVDGAVQADSGARSDSAVASDAGFSERDRDAGADGSTDSAAGPSDGGRVADSAAAAECPGAFAEIQGTCPAGWTCTSPLTAPGLLCGIEIFQASDCEDVGGLILPDRGDGSTRCPDDTFIGGVPWGIEGALCCGRSRVDCGACRPAESGAFGCDGDDEQLWECTSGAVPDVLPKLCRDLATGLPRYCCIAAGAPVCEEGT